MNTTHNPDGTVTVTSRGHHRLSELLDTAALAFATERETAVGWPALVATQEIDSDSFAATFRLPVGAGRSVCPKTGERFDLGYVEVVERYADASVYRCPSCGGKHSDRTTRTLQAV